LAGPNIKENIFILNFFFSFGQQFFYVSESIWIGRDKLEKLYLNSVVMKHLFWLDGVKYQKTASNVSPVKINLQLSNQQLMLASLEIQYSYLLNIRPLSGEW